MCDAESRLTELRRMYEPYVQALASYFRVKVPPWIAEENRLDNWQANVLERLTISRNPAGKTRVEHFWR